MIVLFTDFGLLGPYIDQVKAVLHQMAPGIPAIDLFADAPVGNPKASAYPLGGLWRMVSGGSGVSLRRRSRRRRDAPVHDRRGRRPMLRRPRQRLVRVGSAPRPKGAQLGHRLEARASLGQLSRARTVRTGRSHAGAWRAAARSVAHG